MNKNNRKCRTVHNSKMLMCMLVTAVLFAALFAIGNIVNGSYYVLLIITSAMIHECGHIFSAMLLRIPMVRRNKSIISISPRYDFSKASYLSELTVPAMGPLFNISAAFITLRTVGSVTVSVLFFVMTNISFAMFNMLPVSPLDGNGILRCILCCVFDAGTVEELLYTVSLAITFLFEILIVYIQMRIGINIPLILFGIALLMKSVKYN